MGKINAAWSTPSDGALPVSRIKGSKKTGPMEGSQCRARAIFFVEGLVEIYSAVWRTLHMNQRVTASPPLT